MNSTGPKDKCVVLSPYSCSTVGELLRRNILKWTLETGLHVSVHVQVGDKIFDLHKLPLISKSGYFRRVLAELAECRLQDEFPGAEFLEMTEDQCSGNLCERCDLYLNQVVLQSWDDTLIVLQKCQTLLPWAEDLLIVSRCIESLAFMACMEILDPEHRRDQPVVTLQALAGKTWNCKTVKEIASQDLWVKDLIALPFVFFKRIIGSLRGQGMKEKYVSPLIVFYANKWVLWKKTNQFWDNTGDANSKISLILQGIIELLPMEKKANKTIPVGFYFALLSRSLKLSLSDKSRMKLQDHIASLLHLARIDDFILPGNGMESIASSAELATMERIVSICVSSNDKGHTPSSDLSVVAELWDGYLSQIAVDPKLGPRRFMDLIEIVPISHRQTQDHLYRAINTYLMEHMHISQEEKGLVCKYLNCQKLSQETCIDAVQNDLMPLRLIVQALFIQQLNTHQAFRDYSDSFRYTHCSEVSGSLSSSRYQLPKSEPLEPSPYNRGEEDGETCDKTLGFLLQKDEAVKKTEFTRDEYESTSFRIQSLEQELLSLKLSLQQQNITKGTAEQIPGRTKSFGVFGLEARLTSKKGKPLGQVTSCIGYVNWASQRKYASRLLKILQRVTMFRRGKAKRKHAVSSFSDGPSPCDQTLNMHKMKDC
ncbi:hypothetical protein MRB53_004305 [Persea americana]|uniref:Uncharacterized protein n=1 Tax=Persea americana TaxID=3435 RepID=A0ACC2MBP5_PERAE|nr:hypothetical protein MRB53_004305 [Persea americana]